MVRRWVCLLWAMVLVFVLAGKAEAAAAADTRYQPLFQTIREGEHWDAYRPAENRETPRISRRPAPIVGAMGIGLSVAVLIVLSDSRKK